MNGTAETAVAMTGGAVRIALDEKSGLAALIGPALAALATGGGDAPGRNGADDALVGPDGLVTIDFEARPGQGEALLAGLEALGLEGAARFGTTVSGRLPVDALARLEGVGALAVARPAEAITHAGFATNQGDLAMRTDLLRGAEGIDGTGLKIGILSDSFDTASGSDYADDIASGDLPAGVTILDDSYANGSDEGRAMAQLIHDVAPGAEILFHTAFGGIANFAQGIIDLAAAGADIIVDDVIYFAEPMFQDGEIARAVNQAKAMGVAFFSSAGNQGRVSYEDAFRGTSGTMAGKSGTFHDFDPGPGTALSNLVTLSNGESLRLSLQWDEPQLDGATGSPGSASDVDLYIVDQSGAPLAQNVANNTGGDPVATLTYTNTTGSAQTVGVAVELFSGPAPTVIKYVDFDGGTEGSTFETDSGTSFGHNSAEGGLGVGAAFYAETPAYLVDPPVLQDFSSAGGTPIYFAEDGTRLPVPESRQRVDIVAPDGGDTTFFGTDNNDLGPWPNFFGTSAAAPNAAALAALLWERVPTATVDDIYDAMINAAIDIRERQIYGPLPQGVDEDSGHGLIEGGKTLDALLAALDDGFEDNDEMAEAADLTGETLPQLAVQLDDDWYRVDLGAAGDLYVDLAFDHAGGNIDLAIRDASGVLAQSVSTTDDESAVAAIPGAGTYYIEVTGDDRGNDYTLSWSFGAPPPSPQPPTQDRNGDGREDFLWRLANGTVEGQLTGGTPAAIGSVSNDWRVVAAVDISGDGATDLIWRNDVTGVPYLWLLDGDTVTAQRGFGAVGLSWHIAGTPDFDGDGRADLLWRNESGALYGWTLDGTTITQTDSLGSLSTAWHLYGTPDFDGDGKDDILWRNDDGTVYVWIMDGISIGAQRGLGSVPLSWHIVGTPDLDGDGNADIFWRNDSGAIFAWLMDGTTIASQASLGALSTQWQLVGTPDLDADGGNDLLWRHQSTDQLYAWVMDGMTIAAQGSLGNGQGRDVIDFHDTNGDGADDIQLLDTASGEITSMLGNGASPGAASAVATLPAGATYLPEDAGLWDDGFMF